MSVSRHVENPAFLEGTVKGRVHHPEMIQVPDRFLSFLTPGADPRDLTALLERVMTSVRGHGAEDTTPRYRTRTAKIDILQQEKTHI